LAVAHAFHQTSSTAMIRAVLFDVDGVVVHPWRWQERLAQQYGITPAMTADFFRGPFAECAAGRADLLEVLPPFLAAWGWRDTTSAYIEQWCATENAPNHGVLDVVAALRQRGIPCYVASTQERHRATYLETVMQFDRQFDGRFFSSRIGSAKPHPAFFDAIAQRLGRPAEELLFFDDVPAYVQAARQCGWIAETFTSVDLLRSQLYTHLALDFDVLSAG
jgi:putative hydrolase of the HAD superfamily